MQGDDLDWLENGDLNSLEIVERVMALEAEEGDPQDFDADDDETLLVRNQPPKPPRGGSGRRRN